MENNNNNGAYDLEGVLWHQHSNKLAKSILELWPDKSTPIIDLGCGHNFYCSVLEYAGYTAAGVDAVKLKGVDAVVDITSADDIRCLKRGFLRPWQKFDCINVISLEVGEHIPAELSEPYLNNLISFGGDIIMSWAIPGQAGVGHVNCRPNKWVCEQMEARGYSLDLKKSNELRTAVIGCKCDWFLRTLMYFKPTQP